jgi:hypothetical protein
VGAEDEAAGLKEYWIHGALTLHAAMPGRKARAVNYPASLELLQSLLRHGVQGNKRRRRFD